MSQPVIANDTIRIDSHVSERAQRRLAHDVREGLTRDLKELPPKHFYDAYGSELFDRICELPEYYPTRSELAILESEAEQIVADAGSPCELVELGCGATTKARLLLSAMAQAGTLERYVPFDVSESVVMAAAEELTEEFESLRVHGLIGDFERHLESVPRSEGGRMVALLGGTIGNFAPTARLRLLREIAAMLAPGDHLLLGVDLVKDPATLEAAYNDSAGVTAEFNRNVLRVINRELGGDFDLDLFEHVAFFDPDQEWIEMRLRAREACRVRIADLDLEVDFVAGEEIRTEISAKFTPQRLSDDYAAAGLAPAAWYSDADDRFAVTLAAPANG
jgi:L-histidine N-alpha-methyltransferase